MFTSLVGLSIPGFSNTSLFLSIVYKTLISHCFSGKFSGSKPDGKYYNSYNLLSKDKYNLILVIFL